MEVDVKTKAKASVRMRDLAAGTVFRFKDFGGGSTYMRTNRSPEQIGSHVDLRTGLACYNGGEFEVVVVEDAKVTGTVEE